MLSQTLDFLPITATGYQKLVPIQVIQFAVITFLRTAAVGFSMNRGLFCRSGWRDVGVAGVAGGVRAGAGRRAQLLLHQRHQLGLRGHAAHEGTRAQRVRLRGPVQEHTLLRERLSEHRMVSRFLFLSCRCVMSSSRVQVLGHAGHDPHDVRYTIVCASATNYGESLMFVLNPLFNPTGRFSGAHNNKRNYNEKPGAFR